MEIIQSMLCEHNEVNLEINNLTHSDIAIFGIVFTLGACSFPLFLDFAVLQVWK